MKDMKKGLGLATAAAALLASGFAASPLQAAPSTMVNCTIISSHGCGNGCSKKERRLMTLEECNQAGGTPERIEGDDSQSKN
jgi:hypothetical protein